MMIKARRQNVMRSVKSKITVAGSAFLLSLLLASSVFPRSCECYTQKHRTDFRRAKAVFVGQVIDIDGKRKTPERLSEGATHSAKFKVERAWKGAWKSEVAVFARRYFLTCGGGFDFQPGERYLVYVFDDHNELVAYTECSRTRPYSRSSFETDKELKQLDSFWFRLSARVIPF